MDGQSYGIQWIQHHGPSDMKTAGQLLVDAQPPQEEEIMANGMIVEGATEYMVDGDDDDDVNTEADIDQIAAENLIFMARDGQMVTEIIASGTDEHDAVVVAANDGMAIDCAAVLEQTSAGIVTNHQVDDTGSCNYSEQFAETTPQMVTEEIITDDWVQRQGEDRVEIPAEQIICSNSQVLLDIDVPLPTVQDEYTALRPYPCDFCSRRFRKKVSLMNHMVAHQNDRPHLCKLCGSRFFRRSDLINHLKAHAETTHPEFDDADFINFVQQEQHQQRKVNDHYYDQDWGMQADAYVIPPAVKSSRNNTQIPSGNSSSTSTSTVTGRGRISRLKPKNESYASICEYVVCQELKADTAAVKLTLDQRSIQQVHYPIIDESKPFVCQQCGLAFAREKALLSHTKSHHRNDSPYECNQCNEIFWESTSLYEHQKTHQFDESNSEYDPAEADDTQSDDESESEKLYGEFYCSECGMSFHRQDLLQRHSKSHALTDVSTGAGDNLDNSKDRHCCNTCGETFAEALDLLAHAEIHARYPAFKCVLCGESFFEEHTIKRHLQSLHTSEMTPNSCILCGKECRDRKALIKHAWDHSREKCHSCSKCGKNFHNKARLKRHMSSHRDKTVTCDVCQEEFPDGRSLSNHRHSHSATSAGKLFPCHECGKTFGSRSSQQIHVRIHTGERPYGCRFCWKAFADGGTLRKHERIHTGEKPYACSVCPRAFNQRVVLREHIRSHHSGLDEKRGTYFCSVCSAELPSSTDLIQHLIQHSDMNTAMQRQPIAGPRKYKRRRKLKPHEIARLRSENKQNSNASDIDISDFDMENVDEYLGVTEAADEAIKTKTMSKAVINGKRIGKDAPGETDNQSASAETTAGGRCAMEAEEDSVEAEEQSVDGVAAEHGQRYNSITKLINSISNEETYKSMLSNPENTLQSIDTLVVDNGSLRGHYKRKAKYELEGTAQRTKQFKVMKVIPKQLSEMHHITATGSKATRKKVEKQARATRPRMIHTEKSRLPMVDGIKRRSKTYITRTEPGHFELLPKSSTNIVDDYEIISPDALPPKQISSSPLHIKQEHDLHKKQRQHHMSTFSSQGSNTSRSSDMYDGQLLLEASTLRKDTLEKFNPNLVNVLEDIFRSPVKCDKGERHRFTSESSTQFLVEHSEEEEQHLIKIEPTSPDLREIVSGAGVSSGSGAANTSIDSGSGSSAERRSTRCTRSNRLVTANRKYLEFETDISPVPKFKTTATQQMRHLASTNKPQNVSKIRKEPSASVKKLPASYFSYTVATFNVESPVSASPSSGAAALSASALNYSSISVVASPTDATSATAGVATAAITTPVERKHRYFECEMCSAVFPDRAQLLDHVPIHI